MRPEDATTDAVVFVAMSAANTLTAEAKLGVCNDLYTAWTGGHEGHLTRKTLRGLAQAFQPDDKTKRLSRSDKKKGMKQKTMKVTDTQLDNLVRAIDADNSQDISQDEFADFFMAAINQRFSTFDEDRSGFIDGSELAAFVDTVLSDAEVARGRKSSKVLKTKYLSKVDGKDCLRCRCCCTTRFSLLCFLC